MSLRIVKKVAEYFSFLKKGGYSWELVPRHEAKARLAICEGCEDFDSNFRKCKICGCLMDIKTKLAFDPVESTLQGERVATACPAEKW